jgi:hypothetical protein
VERPELKLVTQVPRRAGSPAAVALGAAMLVFATVATVFGADRHRAAFDAGAAAETALARTLSSGDPAPAQEAEQALRTRLAEAPLDATLRTVAASLAAEIATTPQERDAAIAQARAATRLIASDEWIASGTARVLARCGRADLALAEVARIFAYAPEAAATALAAIEPWIDPDRLEDGIPATPAAWLAWSTRLRQSGRDADANARLAATVARFPSDLSAWVAAATLAASRDRVDELRRLVPPEGSIPETAKAAPLFAYRARAHASSGEAVAARDDAARAVALSGGDPWVMALAGDGVAAIDPVLARDYWTRSLYKLMQSKGSREGAIWLRARIARLNEREGRGRDALREWRAVLADRPGDPEAKRRIAELTGRAD